MPGARPANSLEASRTKKRNNFLEKNPVKTRENYCFDIGSWRSLTGKMSSEGMPLTEATTLL
jgi:hypothetical protein